MLMSKSHVHLWMTMGIKDGGIGPELELISAHDITYKSSISIFIGGTVVFLA